MGSSLFPCIDKSLCICSFQALDKGITYISSALYFIAFGISFRIFLKEYKKSPNFFYILCNFFSVLFFLSQLGSYVITLFDICIKVESNSSERIIFLLINNIPPQILILMMLSHFCLIQELISLNDLKYKEGLGPLLLKSFFIGAIIILIGINILLFKGIIGEDPSRSDPSSFMGLSPLFYDVCFFLCFLALLSNGLFLSSKLEKLKYWDHKTFSVDHLVFRNLFFSILSVIFAFLFAINLHLIFIYGIEYFFATPTIRFVIFDISTILSYIFLRSSLICFKKIKMFNENPEFGKSDAKLLESNEATFKSTIIVSNQINLTTNS